MTRELAHAAPRMTWTGSTMPASRTPLWRILALATAAGCDAGAACAGCDFPQFTVSGGDAAVHTTAAIANAPTTPPGPTAEANERPSDATADDTSAAGTSVAPAGTGPLTTPPPSYSVIYRDYGGNGATTSNTDAGLSAPPPPPPPGAPATDGGEDGGPQQSTESAIPLPGDLVILPYAPPPRREVRPMAPEAPLKGGASYPVPVMPTTGGVFYQPHSGP